MSDRKLYKWIPVFCAMFIIIAFTLQNGADSAQLSSSVQQAIADFFKKLGVSQNVIDGAWWNQYKTFRRLAHIPEYLLLGIAAMAVIKDMRALPFCALMSLCDEILKFFTPGKEFDILDMAFDAVGYILGIGIVTLIIKRKTLKEKSLDTTYR